MENETFLYLTVKQNNTFPSSYYLFAGYFWFPGCLCFKVQQFYVDC